MIGYIISFVLGIVATVIYFRKFNKVKDEELNIDKALEYLKSRGLYVKISTWGKDKGRD